MFSNELFEIITHGREEVNIEYKDSMNWKVQYTRHELIRALLAMANNTDGGYIVFGVKELRDKSFNPQGMQEEHYLSFNHDDVARKIRNYCDPVLQFNLIADEIEIDGEMKKFVVLEIPEAKEPAICTKGERINSVESWLPTNIALRKNAIYIRSKTPVESREIASTPEWRELINRIVEKNKTDLIKRMPCSVSESMKIFSDSKKFDDDLIRDEI